MARVKTKVCSAQLPNHASRKKRCIIHTEYISLFSDLLNPSSVIFSFLCSPTHRHLPQNQ